MDELVHETKKRKAPAPAAAVAAGKAAPVLPWMRLPITIGAGGIDLDKISGLPPPLTAAIKKRLGFKELFPVQCAVWTQTAGGLSDSHDLCIACPTGSGKTLAYALPVINALSRGRTVRGCHRLQALVVLPTRDLATQVHEVFRALCPSVGLECGLASGGGKSLEQEARDLIDPPSWLEDSSEGNSGVYNQRCVDVLVATPGRLVAHLEGTEGFTLQHLRLMVVDETDRLLRQAYSDWLPKVLSQLGEGSHRDEGRAAEGLEGQGMGSWPRRRVVKLIVSATLTRDPSKLKRLDLHCPRYIAASSEDHRYHLSRELREFKVICKTSSEKPLALLALLDVLTSEEGEGEGGGRAGGTVVFTSSVDMTHRLFLMLEAAAMGSISEGKIVEFSSHVDVKARSRSLARFKSGSAKILVASDAMTRGMDVDCIVNVVNYDTPSHAKTYVHRAGRTARAGRTGRVFSLLRPEDVRHFKEMIRKVDNTFVRDWKGLTREKIEGCQSRLDTALVQVQDLLAAEMKQKINHVHPGSSTDISNS